MGFFDRMTNLGKGVGKVWARSAKEAVDRLQDGLSDWESEDNRREGVDPTERKLQMLERLRNEGLLTEDEYRIKRAAVLGAAPAGAAEDAPRSEAKPKGKWRDLAPDDDGDAPDPPATSEPNPKRKKRDL